MHTYRLQVSFGDCDPAGIVFYPNMFRWMDATFHDYLRRFGGHAAICRELGSIGIGTMNVAATFRSSLRDGDGVDIRVSLGQARPKSLDLAYSGFVGQRLAFEGKETRALFVRSDKGISAGEIGPLVALLAGPEQSD